MSPRTGSETGSSWLVPVGMLSLALVAAISWLVVRPGQPEAPVAASASGPMEGAADLVFDASHSLPYDRARIDVRRTGQTFRITAWATRDGRAATTLGVVSAGRDRVSWAGSDPSLALAIIPGDARDVSSLDAGRVHARYLSDVDLTAVAVERVQRDHPERLIWTGADGRPVDSEDSKIQSVAVSAGTYAITVFQDLPLHLWGYFDRRNGVWITSRLPEEPVDVLGIAGPGFYDGHQFTEASWVGLLPAGATDPELVTHPGVVWDAAPLGVTGRLAVVVFTDASRAGHSGIRSISYTDESGVRRTERS